MQQIKDSQTADPQATLETSQAMKRLEMALKGTASHKGRFSCFAWEQLSVQETATAMSCSEGSVKTHYSRGVSALREKLEDVWP